MLWVGWYGFNAGSAGAADGVAANAFLTTTMATAVASFVWPMVEWMIKGKPSVLGFCSGAVAGLVVITPACGFVTVGGAVLIGICAGIVPFLACAYLKAKLGYDDALDTFGVHAESVQSIIISKLGLQVSAGEEGNNSGTDPDKDSSSDSD